MKNLCRFVVLAVLFVVYPTNAETHNITFPKPQCDGKERATTLLDVANDFLNKAKDLYPDCVDDDGLHCGRKEKSLAFLDVASNLISEVKNNFTTCPETKCPKNITKLITKPIDCSEILQSGNKKSGNYTIWPRSRTISNRGIVVYCDMETDGGGWTVIQRRGKFSTPSNYFYKDWKSYKMGFGEVNEEFWLGNDNIYAISNQANCKIRFDLKAAKGVTGYAQYDSFWIEDELSNYAIHISGYSGNVGDSMGYHNNMKFSTKDRNNDNRGTCATDFQGAWWYDSCYHSNLNGLNQPGVDSNTGIIWDSWKKKVCLAEVEMKLRPKGD